MKVEEIPLFPSVVSPSNFINQYRLEAPEFLRILIEQVGGIAGLNSLEELPVDNIAPLLGGKMSLIYGLRIDGRWVVVKFRSRGGQAEAEALQAWKQVGACVVGPIRYGALPLAGHIKEKINYLVMEAAVDGGNHIAQTAQQYLIENPGEAGEVAVPLGKALASMHRAEAGPDFGEFADMNGNHNSHPPQDWAGYLVGYIDKHREDLLRLGYSAEKIEALRHRISHIEFSPRGVMLHGDFSARNSALTSHLPYQVKVFDPNPIVGHPSWDLAILKNNCDFSMRRSAWRPEREDFSAKRAVEDATLEGVLQGYRDAGGEVPSGDAIAAAQLMQCLYLLPQKVYKAKARGKKVSDDLESQVVRDTMSEKMERLTGD